MRYLILLLLVLSGCNNLYFPEPIEGMRIVEVVHTDPEALYNACPPDSYGRYVEACAILVGMTCTLHLPERYSPFLYDHELTHCYGRKDAPPIGMWKS